MDVTSSPFACLLISIRPTSCLMNAATGLSSCHFEIFRWYATTRLRSERGRKREGGREGGERERAGEEEKESGRGIERERERRQIQHKYQSQRQGACAWRVFVGKLHHTFVRQEEAYYTGGCMPTRTPC